MKKTIIFLLFGAIVLTGCSNESKVITNTEEIFNNQDIQQSTPIVLDEIEKLESENKKFSQENEKLQKQISEYQEKSMLMSKSEVIDLLKSTNNENPIFYDENSFGNNEKFKLISSNSKPIYNQLKTFLQKINLGELYDLETVAGNKKLTKSHCEKIITEYKKTTNDDVDSKICNWGLNNDNTYNGEPLFVYVYQINSEYFYLNILQEELGGANFFNVLYDIENQKVFNLSNELKNINVAYFYQNKIWFKEFNSITGTFDLETNKFKDLSKSFHNKSHKWWIKEDSDTNFIVESFDRTKTVNLGKIENNNIKKPFEYIKKSVYFETNNSNTYFALLEDISHRDNNNYISKIRYGNLKENDLKNSKTFEVKYEPFETMCWEGANQALFLKDNLIITTTGCPSMLELTVFDIESESFLYRHNSVERDYINENPKEKNKNLPFE